jgi:hypothetical protein
VRLYCERGGGEHGLAADGERCLHQVIDGAGGGREHVTQRFHGEWISRRQFAHQGARRLGRCFRAALTMARTYSRDMACLHRVRRRVGNKRIRHIGTGFERHRDAHVPPLGEPSMRSIPRGAPAYTRPIMVGTDDDVRRLARQHERTDASGGGRRPCRHGAGPRQR